MQKILVILPNNLGDVFMALPVLNGLKRKNRENEITFFVEDGYQAALENNSDCDNVFLFNRKKIKETIACEKLKSSVDFLREHASLIFNENFNRVINFGQHSYTALLLSLINAEEISGKQYLREGNYSITDEWSLYLYAIPFARQYNSLHVCDIYKRIAGVESIKTEYYVAITEDEKKNILDKIFGGSLPDRKIAIIQPGAAYESKRWGVENFAALSKLLAGDGYQIIITGAQAEKNIAKGICEQLDNNCKITAGDLTFRETTALISFCELCVTGDTAIMHAAAALKKRVFALFGPTNPVETGPYASGNFVFSGRCTQRPCFCTSCKNKLCMKSIRPETVFSFIKGDPDGESSCDIYSTTFDDHGDFKLIPVIEKGVPYFDEGGAALTRLLFETSSCKSFDVKSIQGFEEIIKNYLEKIQNVEYCLSQYLHSNEINFISEFEKKRKQLISDRGITDFLTAILNLKLNSIGLLDPITGIKESLSVCTKYRKLINDKTGIYL